MIDDIINQGIINPEEIDKVLNIFSLQDIKAVFVDTSFVLPTSGENVFENFKRERISEAVFFDIEAISNTRSPLPHMLPDTGVFNAAMSDLGLHKNDLLILYGQHGMIMGPARVWWMMRGFGHSRVLVLNGGLPAWKAAGFKTQTAPPRIPIKSAYKASAFNPDMVVDLAQIMDISQTKTYPILDARPAARYNGTSPEPRAGMRSGHIPNSLNLPCSLLVNEDGRFKSTQQIAGLFENIGLNPNRNKKIVLTCGSGITACSLGLALFTLGNTNFSVYDGSWSEWGHEDTPTTLSTNIEKA